MELCDTLCKGLFAERNRQTLVFALERSFCKVASKLNLEAVPWFASDDAAVLAAMTCPYGSKVEAVNAVGVKMIMVIVPMTCPYANGGDYDDLPVGTVQRWRRSTLSAVF